MDVFERFFFESLITPWGIRLNARPSEAESGLVNLQAGEPVCHPAACKFITLKELSIFHDPVYKKPGVFFFMAALFGQKQAIFSTERA